MYQSMNHKHCEQICLFCSKTFVCQYYTLLNAKEKYQDISVHDNIAIGDGPKSNITTVKSSAIQSGAHDYIRTFDAFYQTKLRKKHDYTYPDDYIPRARYANVETDRQI